MAPRPQGWLGPMAGDSHQTEISIPGVVCRIIRGTPAWKGVHTKLVGTFRAKGHADGVHLAAAPPNEPHRSSPTQGNAHFLRMHPWKERLGPPWPGRV